TTLKQLQKRFPPQGKIALTGHAHIDLAWLWPYDETRRKVRRTFHTALDMIKKSPDFIFNQSTAAYYAQLETDDPELLAAITEQVKAGRWEVLGGMWVEPDTNMPTGESLTRQILYGQRYFEKQFGARHKVCWLPDCFGFSGALPQLLKQGGMESFFTIKVNWSENNQFPHDIFWWEGLDGSRVLAHTFDNPMEGYNGSVRPDCHLPTWQNFRSKTKHDETLLAVGYGDGGGGVTPEMLTREKQLRDFPALPTARWSHVSEFFERLHQGEPNTGYPAWQGEIYLELHRGTLTSQSHTKRLHRHAERALITAETLGSMAALMGGSRPNHIETLWHKVLKNEFHDILPGSSIKEVYEDAEAELSKVIEQGQKLQQSAIADLRNQLQSGNIQNALLVVNPSNSPRPVEASLANGQHYTNDAIVPALGYLVCDLDQKTSSDALKISLTSLENNYLKVCIGNDGTITSLIHKPTGREALADRGNQLWVYPADKPREWDAWEIEEDYAQNGHELTDVNSIKITEQSAHRIALQIVKKFRHSTITQTFSLTATSKRLDIETKIDWHDRRVLLRVQNPVAIRTAQATFECAYGVVKRSTHNNTSWDEAQFEVPAHRFSDLSEPDFGVALLNNGKYGHSAKGNILGLSLVRAPIYPDPLADEGEQIFTYALYPHANEWYNGGVREEAEALNQPLITLETSNLAAQSRSIVEINGVNAALSTLKPAENDDGFVLRLYEPAGRRGTLKFTLPTGWQIGDALTIMEEASDQPNRQNLTPFEVGSWKIEKQ
ncbi:MAG: alpha-mannosidase, partial [OCS116 cluster bacterium]|nr:alpha-mannosidase [OCS116 cluster bacterium]